MKVVGKLIFKDSTQREILIKNSLAECTMILGESNQTKKLGSWFINCGYNTLTLAVTDIEVGEKLEMSFGSATEELTVETDAQNGQHETKKYKKAIGASVDNCEGKIKLIVMCERSDEEITTEHSHQLVENLETNSRLKAELESLKAKISELENENTALSKEKEDAQIKAASLEKSIAETKQKISEFERQREKLVQEQEELQALEEAASMDVSRVSESVALLKKRALDNLDAAHMMDDCFKKKKPISNELSSILKRIEAVEERLRIIINFQEKLSVEIYRAIANSDGNGMIDVEAESGRRKSNGNGSSTESTNEQSA